MSRYLNSPREADWYACPSCGDEVRVGSSGCQRCNSPGSSLESEEDLDLSDAEPDFDYSEWKKREFGRASRFKPHHFAWKWWITGILLLLGMVWGLIFAGFMRH